jgi:cell division protein FtsA
LIEAQVARLNNIMKAVHQAGYEISNIFFTSLGAAESVLDQGAKRNGCALVDIGAHVTAVLVFKDGFLKYVDYIPMGGDHFTQRVAQNLNLPFDLAEDIKKSYAGALKTDVKREEEVLVKKDSSYIPIKKDVICQSIQPEITKLVGLIHQTLKNSRLYDRLNSGIIMVGGGSLLSGLLEWIEEHTHLPVRMGKLSMPALKVNHTFSYISAIGLAREGFYKTMRGGLQPQRQGRLWEGLSHRIRELYQEYF